MKWKHSSKTPHNCRNIKACFVPFHATNLMSANEDDWLNLQKRSPPKKRSPPANEKITTKRLNLRRADCRYRCSWSREMCQTVSPSKRQSPIRRINIDNPTKNLFYAHLQPDFKLHKIHWHNFLTLLNIDTILPDICHWYHTAFALFRQLQKVRQKVCKFATK